MTTDKVEVEDKRQKIMDVALKAVEEGIAEMESSDKDFIAHAIMVNADDKRTWVAIEPSVFESAAGKDQLGLFLHAAAAKYKAVGMFLLTDVRFWKMGDVDPATLGLHEGVDVNEWFHNLPNEERSKVGKLCEAVAATVSMPGENHMIMQEYFRENGPEDGKVVGRGKLTIDMEPAENFSLSSPEKMKDVAGRFSNFIPPAEASDNAS